MGFVPHLPTPSVFIHKVTYVGLGEGEFRSQISIFGGPFSLREDSEMDLGDLKPHLPLLVGIPLPMAVPGKNENMSSIVIDYFLRKRTAKAWTTKGSHCSVDNQSTTLNAHQIEVRG